MYQRQFQKLSPQTTAHLAQTMSLLNMNFGDLNQEINKALNENPALVVREERRCPGCGHILAEGQMCPICTQPKTGSSEEAIVFLSARGEFIPKGSSLGLDDFADDMMGTENLTLEEFVLRQIASDLKEGDRLIAAYILNQLDEDGLFREDLADVAEYFHVSLADLKRIKGIIQKAEPIGVGSASPEEAIQIQIKELSESAEIPEIYIKISEKYLRPLLKKQFKEISDQLNTSLKTIADAAEYFSKNLNPFPARTHWGDFRSPGKGEDLGYSNPDVVINHINNDPNQPLLIEIVIPSIANLDINPFYNQAIKEAGDDAKDELKTDFEKANLLIKCIQQRNNTMQRLVERITDIQKDFILKGENHIKPITRVKISKELDVHESTISRAVSNKTVQMPDGRIIPMSTFFDRSLKVRSVMKGIINLENKLNPLSDSEIKSHLEKKGFKVARRTVAKYRLMEGIMPAHQRKMNPIGKKD
jgi:RNA polymerase sigma-54 factor